MSYPDWLKIGQKKNEKIHVGKVKQESIDEGEMAVGSPSDAARKLARVVEQHDATAKILVVGNGVFSNNLSDYAITMGQRLDCEIIALSIFEKHCPEPSGSDENGKSHFHKRLELGAARFADKATNSGIKFHQFARTGRKKEVIAEILKEVAGVRYVLSEPDNELAEEQGGRIQLPVIDMAGSQS